MVKNPPSSSSLRGSTSTLSLRPSQTEAPAAAPLFPPVAATLSHSPSTHFAPSSSSFLPPLEDEDDATESAHTGEAYRPNAQDIDNIQRKLAWDIAELEVGRGNEDSECSIDYLRKFLREMTSLYEAGLDNPAASTEPELRKRIQSLRLHQYHVWQPGYYPGSCECGPQVNELNESATAEALETVEDMLRSHQRRKEIPSPEEQAAAQKHIASLRAMIAQLSDPSIDILDILYPEPTFPGGGWHPAYDNAILPLSKEMARLICERNNIMDTELMASNPEYAKMKMDSQINTPAPPEGNQPIFRPASAMATPDSLHSIADHLNATDFPSVSEGSRLPRANVFNQTAPDLASTSNAAPTPSSYKPSAKKDLLQHIKSLRAHLEHISQPGYRQGTCDCGPRVRELNTFETQEATGRLEAVLDLRVEKEREKLKQEKEQDLKDKQARLKGLAKAKEEAEMRKREEALLEQMNSTTYNQWKSNQHEEPEKEKEQTVEAYLRMIRSNVDQQSERLSLGKQSFNPNGYTPQSTLFSRFDSSLNSERQMGDSRSGYDALKLDHLEGSSTPLPFKVSAKPGSTYPLPVELMPSLYEGFTGESLISKLTENGKKTLVPVPQPTDRLQCGSQAAQTEDQTRTTEAESKDQLLGEVCDYCLPRKIRCSRELPSCSNCVRFGLQCKSDQSFQPFISAFQPASAQPQFVRQAPTVNLFGDTAVMQGQGNSLLTNGLERQVKEQNVLKGPEAYIQPFCEFLTENPTVWHAVQYFEKKLDAAGFQKLSERQTWNSNLEKGGKYYVSRNGSSLIAFTVGANYKSGNGVAMIAGHVDALTARLKPISTRTTKAGYVQLGVAPYAGALNSTWWDRDLGIGGRVLVKDGTTGKIETKLVKLGWPIARIPTLAPHFGVGMTGSNNAETEAVPIIGLDYSSPSSTSSDFENLTLGGAGSFAATQPPKLVRAIAGELSIQEYSSIVNWELELYDTQPAQVGGLEKEFIFAGRIDDKLCSWAAMEGLLASAASSTSVAEDDGIVKLVGVFDDEEIGSLLRQGARGNFLPSTIQRIAESLSSSSSANIVSQTYANSFLISADVTHAVNPNFLSKYLENHAPRLNVGLVVCADSNGHMTTDSVSTALLTRVAEKSKSELQLFMIRNDSRSGGTVGPMLSSAMGVRAIDAGIPQLSMHSIRATTGSLDPGLGVKIFKGFFDHFESIDKEFE